MSQPNEQPQQPTGVPPAVERAEFLVDQLGVKLGEWASVASDRLQRLWARTREEGEDIWAEAQDIRRRNAVGIGPAGRTDTAASGQSSASSSASEAASS